MTNDRRLYLVTGATGFVGGEVAKLLASSGKRVRVFIRKPERAAEFEKLGCEVAFGDLTDRASLVRATTNVYGVYHIGAIYREAGLPEKAYFDVNAEGTRNVFEAAIAAGAKRVVHCSTGGVLGHISNPPGNENTPYNPGDVYQRSKVEGEKIALEYFNSGKIGGAIIRPGMVYGPGDTRHLKLFKMVARGTFFYVGRGDAWVNFIDIRDLARSFVLAMEREEFNGSIYTIANNSVMKLHEAVDLIAGKFGVKPPSLHLPVKPVQWLGTVCEIVCKPFNIRPPIFRRRVDFFTKSRFFDASKAHRELGFAPAQPFEKEIEDTVAFYKDHGWI